MEYLDLIISILLCLVFAALSAYGIIYLEMDKYTTRAIVYIKKMKTILDPWVDLTAELSANTEKGHFVTEDIKALARTYHSIKKYKEIPKKIEIVDQMYDLAEPLYYANDSENVIQIIKKRADAIDNLYVMRAEYNACVKKVNDKIDRKISGFVAKIGRVHKLTELKDLTQ